MVDKEEFSRIILSNQALIYKVTRVYTDTAEDQKDLFQDIVFQLWKSFESFKGNSKITTWMYRVAMNTAIAYLNKSKRLARTETTFEIPDIPDHSNRLKEEQSENLYAAIKKLNVIEKGIVFLYLEGKSYREIGEVTGFSESNVGTRMLRIKDKLKKII